MVIDVDTGVDGYIYMHVYKKYLSVCILQIHIYVDIQTTKLE